MVLTISVDVLFFAGAAEAAGCRRLRAAVPAGATLADLAEALRQRFPRLGPFLPSLLWAVNEEYAPPERVLRQGDEVALIPPVSGGSRPATAVAEDGMACRLVRDPISVDDVLQRVTHPEAGAIVLFLGTVRARTGSAVTEALEYDAYPAMAEREMAAIAREASERWPGCRVAIVHRLGRLAVGEVSVVVAASAPHRAEAFAACRYAIDRLKQVVPIWKREFAPGGQPFWVHPDGGAGEG